MPAERWTALASASDQHRQPHAGRRFEPADQLRSDRHGQLAGTGPLGPASCSNLQINRNTVLNAYAGSPRGPGHRAWWRPDAVRLPQRSAAPSLSPELLSMVDGLIDLGRNQGLSADEIGALVASHAQVRRPNQALEVFSWSAIAAWSISSASSSTSSTSRSHPVLLRDFGVVYARGDLGERRLRRIDVLSSVGRAAHVARGRLDLELFAISVRPHLSVLERLERLARDLIVGIAYVAEDEFASERLNRMTGAVRDIGLRQIEIRPLLLPPTPPLDGRLFDGLDAVLVRPNNIAAVRQALPAGLDVIEFANELDSASRAFLAEVFEDLRTRKSMTACG